MAIGSETPAATFAAPTFPVRPFSVDEYHRLGETGILTEEDRVELLEGWITPMMTRGPRHDMCVLLVGEAISPFVGHGWHVRPQFAVTTDDSEPEPDLAVVRGAARDYPNHHPSPRDTTVVVEVADSSLKRDRDKARIYARAGIPVYWIVNLVDNRIEVYTEPVDGGAEYKQTATFERGASVPLVIDGQAIAEVAVDEILP
ncbi:MAG: Uma2 family endonuclease [Pirellulales bacterium]|nr:Uma2 family endonuclease [Pirellulales bacterium]